MDPLPFAFEGARAGRRPHGFHFPRVSTRRLRHPLLACGTLLGSDLGPSTSDTGRFCECSERRCHLQVTSTSPMHREAG
jgi:hypothetical protein